MVRIYMKEEIFAELLQLVAIKANDLVRENEIDVAYFIPATSGSQTVLRFGKYNFKNFFEFVIMDVNGISQVLIWDHNAGDKILKDWEDYKYALALNAIKDAINEEGHSVEEAIKIVARLVDEK